MINVFCNYIFQMPVRLNHNGFTSSNASDFPNCGCKGNKNSRDLDNEKMREDYIYGFLTILN